MNDPRPLSGAETEAWKAIRVRLATAHPWLTDALYRATPVAVDDHPGVVDADRFGRIYVDFAREADQGIPALATQVSEALRTWLDHRSDAARWHAAFDDERFEAHGHADTEQIAVRVASRLRHSPTPERFSDRERHEGDWRDWADRKVGPPQVSWQQVFAGYLRRSIGWKAGSVDYTYSRPSRRQAPGFVLPAMRAPRLAVAVVADVSGSLVEHLPSVTAEVVRVAKGVGIGDRSVTVITCDTEVRDVRPVTAARLDLPATGGGTDMRVGIDAAIRLNPTPSVVVVLTDGFTPWHDRRPAVPVIVGLFGEPIRREVARARAPKWAQIIEIDLEPSVA